MIIVFFLFLEIITSLLTIIASCNVFSRKRTRRREGSNEYDDDHDREKEQEEGEKTPSPCIACFTDFEQMT